MCVLARVMRHKLQETASHIARPCLGIGHHLMPDPLPTQPFGDAHILDLTTAGGLMREAIKRGQLVAGDNLALQLPDDKPHMGLPINPAEHHLIECIGRGFPFRTKMIFAKQRQNRRNILWPCDAEAHGH